MLVGMVAMAAIVVLANILVQFLVGTWLTWGAFVYPFAFLVTDVMNRAFGPSAARAVVAAGFVIGVLCSIAGSFITTEFGVLVPLRVAVGSGIAFLVAQLLDIAIFDRLRQGAWWRAPLVSSLFGSFIDTLLFFGIAFSAQLVFLDPDYDVGWANTWGALPVIGIEGPFWVGLAIADYLVKFGVALVALFPFRAITAKLAEPHSQ